MGPISAQGWAGQHSAVSGQLHCASPVSLGFCSSLSFSLSLLLLLFYITLIQLLNCSCFNLCFLPFSSFHPHSTERSGLLSEQLCGILLPAGG